MNTKMTEDTYILAFRQYTRAIISFNFFVKMDEESHNKYHSKEYKRRQFMQEYDRSGLDALTYFEKCLESWPNQGLNLERRGTRGGTFKSSNGRNTQKSRGGSVAVAAQQGLPSPFSPGSTPVVPPEPKPSTIIVNEPKHDIEMGRISSEGVQLSSQDQGLKNVLNRESFEDHCDKFLLGSNRSEHSKPENMIYPLLNGGKLETPKTQTSNQNREIHVSSSSSSYSSENQSLTNSMSNSNASEMPFDSVYEVTDEESAMSGEHDCIMQNLQPQRKIGGARHGQLIENVGMLNGFEDYTLYIRLLIVELKILLMPIYKSLEKSRNEHDLSYLGAGGITEHNSADNNSFEDSDLESPGSSSFSVTNVNKNNCFFKPIQPKYTQTEDDLLYSNSNLNSSQNKERRALDDRLEMYKKIFDRKDTLRRDEIENRSELEKLEFDLKCLGIKVNAYSSRRLTKIKRMGLTKIKKSFL